MNDFEYKVERILTANIIEDLIKIGAYIPQFEFNAISMAHNQDKKFSYLELSLDNYIKRETKKEISDTDLIAFYDRQNHESHRYEIPERRSGIVWTFNADSYVGSERSSYTDNAIKAYYDTHITSAEFQDQPSRVQVRTLVLELPVNNRNKTYKEAQNIRSELIKNPSSFADRVSELSVDTETKNNGGLVPFFAKGEKEPLFERTAFLLKSPGDISEVIETSRGFEILQLVEKKLRTVKPLSAVKDSIKKKLVKEQFNDSFESDVRSLISQDNDLATISAFAEKNHAQKQNLTHVSAEDRQQTKLVKKLFEIKGLNKANFFVDADKGEGFIVYLTGIDNKYTPDFEQVKEKVKADFDLFFAEKALKVDLQEARALANSLSMQELQQKFGGIIGVSDWLSPQNTDQLTAFFPKNTPLSSILELEMTGSLFSTVVKDKGILVKVDAVKPLDQTNLGVNNSKQKDLKAELEKAQNRLVFDGFVASLFKNATIETHESMFTAE